ncbi:MAG: hypothetical protein KDA53_06035 [Hyphomonas sp.]|nr:hypothetical protein [Hyphomonas sp.]
MKLRAMMAGVALAAVCTASVCAQEGIEILSIEDEDTGMAETPAEACPDAGEGGYFFWMEPQSAEPGDEIALFPYFANMPGMYDSLPAECLSDVTVLPEGLAAVSRQEDGLPIVTIAADAPAGERLVISAVYPGDRSLTGIVELYRRQDNPLVGTWRQASEDCPAGIPIRELVFTAGGEFSVTWTPFESYKDYWGSYDYDAGSGAIQLEVEGGNRVPENIAPGGTAMLTGDSLSFDDLSFGTPFPDAAACSAEFAR